MQNNLSMEHVLNRILKAFYEQSNIALLEERKWDKKVSNLSDRNLYQTDMIISKWT